ELALFPVVYFLRAGAEATDEGLRITPPPARLPGQSLWKAARQVMRDSVVESARVFVRLFEQPGVYRLLVFLLLIAFIKLVLMQIYYVYPKFGIRELGDGAPVGRLWAINSILIVCLLPIVGALTQKYPAYSMVVLGSTFTAASVFIM